MPRKQKAAMTRRSSTVWGFMQKSVGGEPDLQDPKQHPGVPIWKECDSLSHSPGVPGES